MNQASFLELLDRVILTIVCLVNQTESLPKPAI